jgi:cytochrome c oxidase subunit IV
VGAHGHHLAILVPPGVILILIALMAWEGEYTYLTRLLYFYSAPAAIAE